MGMQNHSFDQILSVFKGKNAFLLKEVKQGLEKENLRVSLNKTLSQKKHPIALGSALTHPNLTLDFAEAQLEFVTKAYPKVEEALKELSDLHAFVYQSIGDEMLWPHSAPCFLPDNSHIQLAHFGMTKKGYEKWLYRKGLSLRCGKKMQLLSGIHYNFSFNEIFWKTLYRELKITENFKEFVSESYLSLMRNFLRLGWLSSYLFGASPAVDETFIDRIEKPIQRMHKKTLYGKDATSIRMSHLGYFNKIQLQYMISFNSLKEYRKDILKALNTPHPFYEKIGLYRKEERVQISNNFLQIEAEHYSRIRPKAYSNKEIRPIDALEQGIGYFEVRNIDINPFCPLGIEKEWLYFNHLFFIYCLFKKSPLFLLNAAKIVCDNQNKVALFGRRENLRLTCDISLKQTSLKKWAMTLLEEMAPIAAHLDDKDKKFSKALIKQIKKVEDSNLTPSKQQLNVLEGKKIEFRDFIFEKACIYADLFQKKKLPHPIFDSLKKRAQDSLKELEKLEYESEDVLYGYEDMEPSTQMLLREAYREGVGVEIIDRKENIVRLSNSKNSIKVKQATISEKELEISYSFIINKRATQEILKEKKLNVLPSSLYLNAKEAEKKYKNYQNQKIVVKPNHANFGDGISFVDPNQKEDFLKALQIVEKMEDQILIEPFFEGEEYRFLVMGNKVIAVSKRVPANVVGDGKHTIAELVLIKNKAIEHRSQFQKPLKITLEIEKNLKKRGYEISSVLKKRERLFLRLNSNVSTGGESFDVTDEVELAYKKIAVKATKALGAFICGVDILIQDIKKEPNIKNYAILELNHNPALFIHRFPTSGKKRYVEKDLLKALLEISKPNELKEKELVRRYLANFSLVMSPRD